MTIQKIHWNYFLALERDLEVVSRYIEFSDGNFSVYSIELAHLLFAASSEVDVVAKSFCCLVEPTSDPKNINQYREILLPKIPDFTTIEISVPRYELRSQPWLNWADRKNPDWWRSYNNVKHKRDAHFHEATLKNVLDAMGALLIMTAHYYAYKLQSDSSNTFDVSCIMQKLNPHPALLQLPHSYYHAW
ncbi:MAG: hypothetical protein RLZZ215_313 [Pseudomonadota bacterium]|jgi:hypothetical protein